MPVSSDGIESEGSVKCNKWDEWWKLESHHEMVEIKVKMLKAGKTMLAEQITRLTGICVGG